MVKNTIIAISTPILLLLLSFSVQINGDNSYLLRSRNLTTVLENQSLIFIKNKVPEADRPSANVSIYMNTNVTVSKGNPPEGSRLLEGGDGPLNIHESNIAIPSGLEPHRHFKPQKAC